jgi:hypothetical protein
MMRCGILIIGSLLWDDGKSGERAKWREARLDASAMTHVRVPVYYGRKAATRGGTYTMAFRTGESSAQGVVMPSSTNIKTVGDLVAEACALWLAEDANAKSGTLHKSWGCVGALFRRGIATQQLAAGWVAHFRKVVAQPVSVVNADGLLEIDWPVTLEGSPIDFDIILATATRPEDVGPAIHAVADAWVGQDDGRESYFLNNVKHGIRTPDDIGIWRRIEERSPPWIALPDYAEAIATLRAEAKLLDAVATTDGLLPGNDPKRVDYAGRKLTPSVDRSDST